MNSLRRSIVSPWAAVLVLAAALSGCSLTTQGNKYELAWKHEKAMTGQNVGREYSGPDTELLLGVGGIAASIATQSWIPAVALGVRSVGNAGAELLKSPATAIDNMTTRTR